MIRRRFLLVAAVVLVPFLGALPFAPGVRAADPVPDRLSDQEFWKLVSDFSEPNGSFRSDNLLSYEIGFPYVIADLIRVAKPGRV